MRNDCKKLMKYRGGLKKIKVLFMKGEYLEKWVKEVKNWIVEKMIILFQIKVNIIKSKF